MTRLRMGLIGLGFGQHHLSTLFTMSDVDLVSVADRSSKQLESISRQYNLKPYRDAIAMMEEEVLDAVSICIPPKGRKDILEYAAKRRIAMFIEKPWASSLEQAKEFAALCYLHQATVMPGFSFRFLPAITTLKTLIANELGEPWLLNAEYLFDWLPDPDSWLWAKDNGNGFFNENSCHLFDSVCYLLGKPATVFAMGTSHRGSPSEEVANVNIRFTSGALASLSIGGLASAEFRTFPRIQLICRNGQALLQGKNHMWEHLSWCTRELAFLKTLDTAPESLEKTRYYPAFRHFVDSLKNGHALSATVDEGVMAVQIAEAIYKSIDTASPVSISG